MRKEHGRQRSSPVAGRVIDSIGVLFNLIGWVFAVWAPVLVCASVAMAVFGGGSSITLLTVGIAVAVALLWSGGGVALIVLSRQIMLRRVLWVWVGAVLCLLLAGLNVALVASGAYNTAELIAGGVMWAIVLAVVGVWAMVQQRSARTPRPARG